MRTLLLASLVFVCIPISASPENDYMIHCMGCHLADGQGMPPEVPAFDNALSKMADSSRGRAYLVRVPGASQAPLSDGELAAVINWILSSYTNRPFRKFSTQEVSNYRRQILADPASERTQVLAN